MNKQDKEKETRAYHDDNDGDNKENEKDELDKEDNEDNADNQNLMRAVTEDLREDKERRHGTRPPVRSNEDQLRTLGQTRGSRGGQGTSNEERPMMT